MLVINKNKDGIINCEKMIGIKFFKMLKDGSEINLVVEFDNYIFNEKIKIGTPEIISGETEKKVDIKKIHSFFKKLLREEYIYEEEIPYMLLKYLEEVKE